MRDVSEQEPDGDRDRFHLTRRPRDRGGSGREPSAPQSRVVWLATGWDQASARIRRFDPAAEDVGPLQVRQWRLVGRTGRLTAAPDPGARIWARGWLIDELAADGLVTARHPFGVCEFVQAMNPSGIEYDALLVSAPPRRRDVSPLSVEDLGWALRGACETPMPTLWRRRLAIQAVRACLPTRKRHR